METTVGYQRFTANGTVSPFGITRVYSVDFFSSISTSHLALHNAFPSTTDTVWIKCQSDNQGVGTNEWTQGVLFNNGVYVNTGSGNQVVVIGYSSVKA